MCARVLVSFVILLSLCASAQQPATPVAANSDPVYQQLRRIGLSGEAVTVSNFVLKRDAGTFTFSRGSFVFLTPVSGKVTGAVFVGSGEFSLAPPVEDERRSLKLLTREDKMLEEFNGLVLRFTDNTEAEIKAAGPVSKASAGGESLLEHSRDASHKRLHYNLDARILQDLLSGKPGGLFVAFIPGRNYNSKLLFTIDPYGAPEVEPEEVSLRTYDEVKWGVWVAFHYSREYAAGTASGTQLNATIDIEQQKLDTRIERSGMLRGKAETTFAARQDGVRLAPFDLFSSLRVQQVTDASGQPLGFIQENKSEDANFWVILPKALAAGEKFTIQTVYEGKEAVSNEGSGNYYPVARHNWYPSSFGDYATYEMTFAVPKSTKLLATGALIKEYAEGNQNISVWRSEAPQAVAGFNFGEFKAEQVSLEKLGVVVESYANKELPTDAQQLQRLNDLPQRDRPAGTYLSPFSSMNTTSLVKKPLAEAKVAVELYTQFFGPMSYKRVAMTQQTACTYGQSWPGLVYLPICSFFDNTIKQQLGLRDFRGYWRVVGPHEVAHQWWGHTVGWNSYRDQWMSEGFSDFSASLFIQLVWKKPEEFLHFWKEERELLTEKSREGFRAVDVGPVTMGYRLNNSKTGFDIYRRLIYPKGAYILHMIRMMMWQPSAGDAAFQKMMTEFVRSHVNQPASTEDFKAMVEKHMTPGMDLTGNHKMDWFFNEFVYGTTVPSYRLTYSFSPGANGMMLKFMATQANVTDAFAMPVPLYVELADGRIVHVGRIRMKGNVTMEKEIPLQGLKETPKRAILNYYGDVLAGE
jgi:Peptidase family M1 domain